ncbi:MAG: RNA polymerase sigma factor [Opitutus sp.]|nr:RNA polymerase sigma factor [Opitutus sp.]
MPEPDSRPRDFASLYRATLAPLRRYLARLLGNRSDAQDVAHDAYARVYRTMEKEAVGRPEGLLFTTARRLAINQLKRRDHSPVQSAESNIIELSPAQAPGIERVVMARQEWAATEAAIARLPPGCRAVFLLCKFDGLTHPAAAARLGISPKTVEKQHARALRLLRASLRYDDDPRAETTGHTGAAGR